MVHAAFDRKHGKYLNRGRGIPVAACAAGSFVRLHCSPLVILSKKVSSYASL